MHPDCRDVCSVPPAPRPPERTELFQLNLDYGNPGRNTRRAPPADKPRVGAGPRVRLETRPRGRRVEGFPRFRSSPAAPMRFLLLFAGLALLALVPFVLWGDALAAFFTAEGTVAWLHDRGAWAWAAGMGLLVLDLVLPLPGTVILSALGYVYGTVAGGLIGAAGSFLSGTVAYGLCRWLGHGAALRLVGARDLARGERLFERAGGWIVALSRWLPILPEVVACLAGLTRMPAARFFVALACGALPLGFTFAAIGAQGVERPALAVVLSAVVPALLFLAARPVLRRLEER